MSAIDYDIEIFDETMYLAMKVYLQDAFNTVATLPQVVSEDFAKYFKNNTQSFDMLSVLRISLMAQGKTFAPTHHTFQDSFLEFSKLILDASNNQFEKLL